MDVTSWPLVGCKYGEDNYSPPPPNSKKESERGNESELEFEFVLNLELEEVDNEPWDSARRAAI